MGVFSRLFKVGQAEAHAVVDKLEDPIKMTEQGIRDLKKNLDNSLKALAEIKALAIRSRRDLNEYKDKAKSFEQKAIMLVKKANAGQIDEDESNRLAGEALLKKEECIQNAARSEQEVQKFEGNIQKMDQNVKALRSKISHYENELRTLKARARVSDATKKINKSLSNIDSGSTISMLEKMKDKVAQDEALSEAYGDIANENRSLEDEIDAALKDDSSLKASDALADLKAKLKSQNG